MISKGVQPMGVGGGEKWFAIFPRNLASPAVEIKPSLVKMTDFDRVEAIDVFHQTFPHRSAKNEKWMRRKAKKRIAQAAFEHTQISKSAQVLDVFGLDIEQDNIRSLKTHLRRRDENNSHLRRIRENVRAIEDFIMQRNRERSEAELAGAFQQLMRSVIEPILRIVESMDVQVELDPRLLLLVFHNGSLTAGFRPCS